MQMTADAHVDVSQVLEESLREVLAMMFGLPVEGPVESCSDPGDVLTGTIGLTGPEFQGLLQIRSSSGAARSLAAALLGGEEMLGDDVAMIEDSLGELANMLGGAVKQRIDQTGVRIEISLPSVVEGELQAQDEGETESTVLEFLVDGHPFSTSLVHRQAS